MFNNLAMNYYMWLFSTMCWSVIWIWALTFFTSNMKNSIVPYHWYIFISIHNYEMCLSIYDSVSTVFSQMALEVSAWIKNHLFLILLGVVFNGLSSIRKYKATNTTWEEFSRSSNKSRMLMSLLINIKLYWGMWFLIYGRFKVQYACKRGPRSSRRKWNVLYTECWRIITIKSFARSCIVITLQIRNSRTSTLTLMECDRFYLATDHVLREIRNTGKVNMHCLIVTSVTWQKVCTIMGQISNDAFVLVIIYINTKKY